MRSRLRLSPTQLFDFAQNEFAQDAEELRRIEIESSCQHERWRWLDCDECRETIGECGEMICEACGASVD